MTPNGCLTVVNLKEERRFVLCPAPVRLRQEASPDTPRPHGFRARPPKPWRRQMAVGRVARRAKRGAQGRNRTLAYPTESPSLFEWRCSSVPTSGPGAFFTAGGCDPVSPYR